MHIADFLSKTFTDKGEEQKQQRDASTSQADDINILEIEDMEHVDALESTRVTEQNRELTKQDSQLQVLKVTILAGWPDTMGVYHRRLVIQRRTDSSPWGYLQRKPCYHSKCIATRNANKNTYKPHWSRNMFTQRQRCYILTNNDF